MSRILHAITPGDHFSPRTGSAIPTVVHGLAGAARADASLPAYEHLVVIGRSTFHPRYGSAAAIEFDENPPPGRSARLAEIAFARVGMPRRTTARYWHPLAEALRHEPPAIVLAHNAPVLPGLLRGSPHRVVLYAHNDLLRSVARSEAGRMLDSTAAIVCVSESLAQRTRARLPQRLRERVHAIGNGVDCEQFRPAATVTSRERIRVVYLGRTIAEKGADVLLEAVATLDRDDLEVVVIGSHGFDRDAPHTRYEQGLREIAARGVVPVRFMPFEARATVPLLLREADIMVVPSRWDEPSGLIVGEAMASGLAVIASRVGGIPEVLGDAGVLVAPDDPRALAEALVGLLDDPARRARLSRAARDRAVAHDWNASWAQLKRLLAEL